jgi:hypothetical protein
LGFVAEGIAAGIRTGAAGGLGGLGGVVYHVGSDVVFLF